ncbi:phytoene/squalene synthase family protein [Methylocystis sp. H4A]|uniref:phytoene/squalene synthase family protein n=1 Tax=Methylocystis sp. H4A TaxID=2785788 RepID=UPI0018C1D1CE|nr:phytoene/squalene synthase family protein [Methylocystis sp. H4A]MBG0801738.1 phytoene/squalene synthase family protein [Methylocystis sp. H4A]
MSAASREHYVQCEELLRARDRDLWLACLFAPQAARPHIHALYAFAQETADVSGKVTQPLLGEMRLQWWLDALEADAAQGEGVRANPVADALIDTIERFSLPRSEFVALAQAHIFDLYDDAMPTWTALEDYCRATASAPIRWAARILGADLQAPSAGAFDEAGVALGLTRILRALPEGSQQEKFLPDEAFTHDGGASGRRSELGPIVKKWHALAQSHYELARRLAVDLGPARAALLPCATAPLYLEQLARSDYDPFRPLGEPSPLRRQWRIWRASRGVGL